MNDDHEHDPELDPVQRLRAADPAAGVEPSAGFADEVRRAGRRRVDGRAGTGGRPHD